LEWPNIPTVWPLRSRHHFQPDVIGFVVCFLSSSIRDRLTWWLRPEGLVVPSLIGHAEFVDHVLPLRSAGARAIYQTAELSDRPRVRLNHTHNEHP
jgi:hypothetical protein